MKRNTMKKMARTALSLMLILSMFSSFGVMRIAVYADYEGEETVEASAAPVVEAPAAPVVEAPAAPVVEAPAAPVVEAPAAPVVEAPAVPVVEAPAAPVVEAPAAAAESTSEPAAEIPAAIVEAVAETVAEAVAETVAEAAAETAAEPVAEVETQTNAAEEVAESSDEITVEAAEESGSEADAAEEVTTSDAENAAEAEPAAAAETAQSVKRFYEVDFHYEDTKSTLRGDTSSSLDAILAELGLTAAITNVASSNDSLFSCEEVDGVWTVSANQAFDTDESLILTLEDGTTMELLVTDDNAALKYTYYNNENHDIAIEIYENGKMLCVVQNTEAAGEDLAIVQMHDSSGALLTNEQKEELKNLVSSIELGEGVLGVGWTGYNYTDNSDKTDVFHGFSKLVEVIPSSTLQVIGWSAFRKCANLVNFDFSKCTNLQTIMQQAFSSTALETADLSNTKVETISHAAFADCTQLSSVSLPSTVTEIYEQAFYKCSGIESIEYNAADYDHSTTEKGTENPYLASAIFKASGSNDYSLTIGTEVEVLPRGFFKAFAGAGEISFSGMDDNDDCTVAGRTLTLEAGATYDKSAAPFKNLSSDCVVDENGVLYEKLNDTLQITYFSPEITQYTLPKDVRVDSSAIEVGKLGSYANSQVAGTVTYSITANSEIDGMEISDLPDFKISDTVLVLKDSSGSNICRPFTATDLTEASYTGTVKNEDGSSTNYLFTLSGWALEDGTVLSLDEAFSLLNGDISLTSVWSYTAEQIPAEDDAQDAEEPAEDDAQNAEESAADEVHESVIRERKLPEISVSKATAASKTEAPAANETEAPAVSKTEAPAANETEAPAANETEAPAANEKAAPTAATENVPAANLPEAVAPQAAAEVLNDEAVPMAAPQHMADVEEIAEAATPFSAVTLNTSAPAAEAESAEAAEISVNLFLIVLLVLTATAVIIFLGKRSNEENA